MSLGIFKKAWNTTQLNSLTQVITNMISASYVAKDYKEYIANITQSGTDAPTMTIIKNDFSEPVSAYTSTGLYTLDFSAELSGNVAVMITNGSIATEGTCGAYFDTSLIQIYSLKSDFAASNGVITNGTIYIRKYD